MKLKKQIILLVMGMFSIAMFGQDQYRSAATGSWATAATWEISTDNGTNWTAAATVPGNAAMDIVLIRDAHIVTLNQNATVAQVTIGEGLLSSLYYEATATIRTLTITGDLTLSANAVLKHNQSANIEHILNIGGNLTVGTSASFSPYGSSSKGIKFVFSKATPGDQIISSVGTPTAFDFQKIAVSRPNVTDRVLCISSINIKGGNAGLQITNGVFEINAGTITLPSSISGAGALWNHDYATGTLKITGNANAVFTSGIASSSGGQKGTIEFNTTGTILLGHPSTTSSGTTKLDNAATLNIINGTITINGRFITSAGATTISGGTVNVDPQSTQNLAATANAFEVGSSGTLNMSDGIVNVVDPNANTGTGLDVKISGTVNLTGGIISLGDGVSASSGSADGFEVYIATNKYFYNLTVNNPSGTNRHVVLTDHTTKKDVNISNSLNIIAGELKSVAPDASSSSFNLGGSWANTGTFTPGSLTAFNLNGTSAQVTGATFPASVYKLTLANSSGVTITNPLAVSGLLTLGGNGSYTNLSNITGFTGLGYAATVAQVTGAELPASIATLTINNTNGVTLSNDLRIASSLTLTNGLFNIGSHILTFEGAATSGGSPSATAMIISGETGEVRKEWLDNGAFTFALGENTGTLEYSPLTFTLNSNAGLSSAYTTAKVVNAKHPSNLAGDYINRYWIVNGSGITSPDFTVKGFYTTEDIQGSEAAINAAYYSGSAWFTDSLANAAANTLAIYNRTVFGEVTGGNASGISGSTSGIFTISVVPQGFYSGSGTLALSDTMRVYLANTTSPFAMADSATTIIDSVSFSGQATFTHAPTGTYYIVVKHRNSVEAWSKTGGQLFTVGETQSYDFTSSQAQTYGDNAILLGSKYCMYSGDVNTDGFIDFSDLTMVDNDSYEFASGYLVTDVNGDLFVDFSDLTLVDNNSYNFIGVIKPGAKVLRNDIRRVKVKLN